MALKVGTTFNIQNLQLRLARATCTLQFGQVNVTGRNFPGNCPQPGGNHGHRSLARGIDHRQPVERAQRYDRPSFLRTVAGTGKSTGGYDPLAVHYAVVGLQDNYTVAGAGGVNAVNPSNGDNSWSATGGKVSYLGKLLGDRQLASLYNAMVARATLK
jgi:hypothetical protein